MVISNIMESAAGPPCGPSLQQRSGCGVGLRWTLRQDLSQPLGGRLDFRLRSDMARDSQLTRFGARNRFAQHGEARGAGAPDAFGKTLKRSPRSAARRLVSTQPGEMIAPHFAVVQPIALKTSDQLLLVKAWSLTTSTR
jgi:hypothetical protein